MNTSPVDTLKARIESLIAHGEADGGTVLVRVTTLRDALAALSGGEAVAWHSMGTAPRDGTVIVLRFGQDGESPGWWDCPVSPIQNDDGTWPRMDDGHPWAFFDRTDDRLFLNHMTDRDQYGPSHWRPYTTPRAVGDGMVVVPCAMLEQVYGMAREGCDAPTAAYRWCERIDEVFHAGKALEDYADYAQSLPAAPSEGSAQGASTGQVPEGGWRDLYRLQTAMRYMDNNPALTREAAYAMADQDVAGIERVATPPASSQGEG